MTSTGWVAAVDLGATSGRVMLGHLGPDLLSVEAVHRFPNDPVRIPDGLHWNILELYRNLLIGLRKAVRAQPDLAGIGIASWAVDYGLVSGDRLINNRSTTGMSAPPEASIWSTRSLIMPPSTRRMDCSSSRSIRSISWPSIMKPASSMTPPGC